MDSSALIPVGLAFSSFSEVSQFIPLAQQLLQEGYFVHIYIDELETEPIIEQNRAWWPLNVLYTGVKLDTLYFVDSVAQTLEPSRVKHRKLVRLNTPGLSTFELLQEALPINDLKKLGEWYDLDTLRWDNDDRPWSLQIPRIAWLVETLLTLRPESILDVGCGGGNVTWHLTQLPWKPKVIGLDISYEAVKRAAKRVPGAEFQKGFAEQLPFPDLHFDVVCCNEVLEHVSDVQAALLELKRVAKKAVLLSTPSGIDNNIRHVRVFDPNVELKDQDIEVVEYDAGEYNRGWCCHWKLA
jgi:2-polyprenyl-3-methyl-5-hydroxy-6-metoxy-1,4-benzoquinol methylase